MHVGVNEEEASQRGRRAETDSCRERKDVSIWDTSRSTVDSKKWTSSGTSRERSERER